MRKPVPATRQSPSSNYPLTANTYANMTVASAKSTVSPRPASSSPTDVKHETTMVKEGSKETLGTAPLTMYDTMFQHALRGKRDCVFRDSILWNLADKETPSISDFVMTLQKEFGLSDISIKIISEQMQQQLDAYKKNPKAYIDSTRGRSAKAKAKTKSTPKSKAGSSTSRPKLVKQASSGDGIAGKARAVTPTSTPSTTPFNRLKIRKATKRLQEAIQKVVPARPGRIVPEGPCHACRFYHQLTYTCCEVRGHAYCKSKLMQRCKLEFDDKSPQQCHICLLLCKCNACRKMIDERAISIIENHGVIADRHLVPPTEHVSDEKVYKKRKSTPKARTTPSPKASPPAAAALVSTAPSPTSASMDIDTVPKQVLTWSDINTMNVKRCGGCQKVYQMSTQFCESCQVLFDDVLGDKDAPLSL